MYIQKEKKRMKMEKFKENLIQLSDSYLFEIK